MQYCNGSHWVAMGSIMGQGDGLGDHMAGQALDMGGFRIQNLAPPTADNHAVTRAYVTSAIAAIPAPTTPNLSAVLATGNAAGNRKITGLATPTVGTDAAHKTYVDGKFGALTSNKWCRGSGTQVICDQVAPSALPSCPAGVGLVSTGSGWKCVDCTDGPPGSICVGDDAIYIGTVGGNRVYAAPADEAGIPQWKTANTYTSGTQSTTDGLANTYPALNNTTHPAGRACAIKAPAGTWYLPAKDELALLWDNGNRKSPPGEINLTGIGIHASSYYWSSTEYEAYYAWDQRFSDGGQNNTAKTSNYRVRCVRR